MPYDATLDDNRAERLARARYVATRCPICHERISWDDEHEEDYASDHAVHADCASRRAEESILVMSLEQVARDLAEALREHDDSVKPLTAKASAAGAERRALAAEALRLLAAAARVVVAEQRKAVA